jgi:hypothetical protein
MTTRLNGCHNRPPFVAFITLKDGSKMPNFSHGQPCKYTESDLGQKDAGCTGCKWRVVVSSSQQQ